MKKLSAFILCLVLLLAAPLSVSAETAVKDEYKQHLINYLAKTYSPTFYDSKPEDIPCTLIYEHSRASAYESEVPDYVIIEYLTWGDSAFSCGLFGDYVLRSGQISLCYPLGHYVVVPKTGECFTLREAWDNSLLNIEAPFEEGIIGRRIGDINNDRVVSVKDSTMMQKFLSKLIDKESFTWNFDYYHGAADFDRNDFVSGYYSDFNRDGERDIKDATAIQKFVAGIA